MGNKIGYKRYVWRKLSEAQLKKEELEAYMIAAENAVEIVKLMEENQDFQQFASVMKARFDFSLNQTRYLRYMHCISLTRRSGKKRNRNWLA